MKYGHGILLLLFCARAFGMDPFYQDKTAGWFWYQDPKAKTNKETLSRKADLIEAVDDEKEALDKLLKVAIKQPTEENIVNFIRQRNKLIDQSYRFGLRLQQVNLLHPELDQLKTYPVNQVAKEIYASEKREQLEHKIRALSKTHGLFYVFSGRCSYCTAFSSSVKQFAERYGWSVLPVSLDGLSVPGFESVKKNEGLVQKLNITRVPALVMVEPKTGKSIPLATGMISEEEIIERIGLLTREP